MSSIKIEYIFCNIAIIGSGAAGLAAAVHLSKNISSVVVITKTHLLNRTTSLRQGKINVALDTLQNNWESHKFNSINARDGLRDYDSIEILYKNSHNAIKFLENIGVKFDQNILSETIQAALYCEAQKNNVLILNQHFALDLLLDEENCFGILCWNMLDGKIEALIASKTIIATGGYKEIYPITFSIGCTGDGHGLIMRAEGQLQDMEFTQFYPTVIDKTEKLITESSFLGEAYYSIGGIPVNNSCQAIKIINNAETIINNLYAIGEASCLSIHGANKLDYNDLLEIIVFSELATKHIISNHNNITVTNNIIQTEVNKCINAFVEKFRKENDLDLNCIKNKMQIINQNYVNAFRTIQGLQYALHEINILYQQIKTYKISNKNLVNNNELLLYLEIENLLICSLSTIHSAIYRKESRGTHYIEEFPACNNIEFVHHSIINLNNNYIKRSVRSKKS